MGTCRKCWTRLKQVVKSEAFPQAQHTFPHAVFGWHARIVLMRGMCFVLDRKDEKGLLIYLIKPTDHCDYEFLEIDLHC